jgi:DNA replication protein DnaC
MTKTATQEPDPIAVAIKGFAERVQTKYAAGVSLEEAFAHEERERLEKQKADRIAQAMAHVPEQFRSEIPLHPIVSEWLEEFCHGGLSDSARHSLGLFGRPGCGKTHTVWEIVKKAISIGAYDYRSYTASALFRELQPRDRDQSPPRDTLDDLTTTDLLIVDDLGAHRMTDWREETLFEIIDGRYRNRRPTVFTSNVPAKKISLPRAEGGAGLGDRIASRLAGTCRVVAFPPIDHRTGIDYSEGGQ